MDLGLVGRGAVAAIDLRGRCLIARLLRTAVRVANRPCSSFVSEESDSKERLRVSNWIVQRLYNYAVKKTVEL